jgi:signal transduction histidine kinase
MAKDAIENTAEIAQAFHANERSVRIQNYRISCMLALVFMPAGVVLDWQVFPEHTGWFFVLRLACSALLFFIWWLVKTPFGSTHYRLLGLLLPALPAFFIGWMIFDSGGCNSPYYAGMNLILLGAALLLRWNFRESLFVFVEVLVMYVGVCLLHHFFRDRIDTNDLRTFSNNLYFLFVTGAFVVVGSLFYDRLRFREFSLRFQLDKNRQALEESNQKLTELDQVKSRFFANISHELRTPLTLLLAPLEALLQRYRASLDNESKELLLTMQSNGMRLLKLINDLLDLVRLESGVMQVRRDAVALDEFVNGLVSAARRLAEDKRIVLIGHVAPEIGSVVTDRDKLEKIILNLQFNAIKFTPSGGRVEIRAEKQDSQLVLSVKDTGMGISAKNLPNVFSRFWQADDSSRRKYQGVGIGLALVKEFSEVQGGTAEVQSEEGKGTTFTVRLPYEVATAEAVPVTLDETPAQTVNGSVGTVSNQEWLSNLYRRAELFPSMTGVQDGRRANEPVRNGARLPTLLVADDEPDMLRFLKSQLNSHYEVMEASDGQQAVEKAAQFLPDIILLDMMMPEKDGLQACRELRERTSTQTIPIILLTARADEETKVAALSAGASDFLPKPFSTTELHVRIKNLVESHQYQVKLAKQKTVLENTIDQLKETETQLIQTEKLASLGRMSAGIIHEINNPLNFATTGLFTLRNKCKHIAPEQQDEYRDILQDVEEGIKRVKNIVSDLRTFSHPDAESRDQVEVAEIVSSALRFLSNEWKDRVQIEQHLPEHQTIWANKSKLIQVLVNLLQNSIDAMKEKKFENEKSSIWIEGRVENGKSLLILRDNGMGIENKHLDKIFDPFYTTKDVGQGMGLGLSICYRIVQECDGRIGVRTEPGKFCEFTLEFPSKGAAP